MPKALPCSNQKRLGRKEAMATASMSKVPKSVPIRLLGGGGTGRQSIPRVDGILLSSITDYQVPTKIPDHSMDPQFKLPQTVVPTPQSSSHLN